MPTLWESIRLANPSRRGKEPSGRRQRTESDYSVRELPSIGTQKTVRQLIEADRQWNKAQIRDLINSFKVVGEYPSRTGVENCSLPPTVFIENCSGCFPQSFVCL